MSKFKIGDKIVCIETDSETLTANDITYGKEYLVQGTDGDGVDIISDTDDIQYVYNFRFKLVEEKEMEQTAEQIRNEILRIDTRIEEAKKDIENAENERNSLVEKLREKGFELTGEALPYQRPTVGDRVRVVDVSDRMEDEDIVIGYEFVIECDDKSRLPFMDKQMNWFREQSVRKI